MRKKINEVLEFYRGYLHGVLNLAERAEVLVNLHLFEVVYEEVDDVWKDIEKDLIKVIEE